eukprot:3693058-Alexandrium_andersonii.AAC.1
MYSSGGNGARCKGVGHVGAQGADLVGAEAPEELRRVCDGIGEPREDDALTPANEAVDERPPEAPRDPGLRRD